MTPFISFLIILLISSPSYAQTTHPKQPTSRPTSYSTSRPNKQTKKRYYRRTNKRYYRRYYRRQRTFEMRRYSLDLITIGQGDWLFTYFGHNALHLKDYAHARDINFNFGTFSMHNPIQLIKDYIQFKMRYWVAIESYSYAIRRYTWMNRTFSLRKIFLSNKESITLAKYLYNHAKYENRIYPYHHYKSNCSTKLRDGLALAIGPTFKKYAQQKRGWTYRKHIRDKMRPNPFILLFMDFGMGPMADRPLTWWEDMFLPDQLEAYLAAPFWQKIRHKKLVSTAKIIYKRTKPPSWNWNVYPLIYGQILLILLLAAFFWKKTKFRFFFRLLMFFVAFLGTILAFMMFATKMPEPPNNANILLFHPFHWWVWWKTSSSRWKLESTPRLLRHYFMIHLIIGLIYLILKIFSVVPIQTNLHYFIFMLSISLMAIIYFIIYPYPSSIEEDSEQTSTEKNISSSH